MWKKRFLNVVFFGFVALLLGCKEPSVLVVTASHLNVRTTHSMSGAIITSIEKDTVVLPVEKNGQWWKIYLPSGKVGWAYGKYLEETK